MPHFTEDVHHENVVFIVDGENTTLDAEFSALKATLPDYSSVGGTTQGFEDNKEADLIDLQDATLVDLRHQTTILSSAIRHIWYLELRREQLRREKKNLGARIIGLREGIRSLVTIEGIKVD